MALTMAGISASRIGGLSLIAGGALAVLMRFLRPGDVAVSPLGDGATLLERVRILAEHQVLTHISSILGALGVILVLFGLYTIQRAVRDQTASDAFIRFGVLLIAIATIGLVFANGLNHMIAHVINHGANRDVALRTLYTLAVDIQAVKSGILIICGYAFFLGFATFALGLYSRFASGVHKSLAGLACLVAAVALVLLVIGDHVHDLPFYTVARLANIPMNLWAVVLGLALWQGHPSLTAGESD